MKKVALIALFALALSGLAACGGSTTSNSGSNANTITLGASTFSSTSISITKGSTITFTDDQSNGAEHILVNGTNGTFQSETGAADLGGSSGHTLQPGDSFTTAAWNTPGTYHISCTIHPTTMNLTITVTG